MVKYFAYPVESGLDFQTWFEDQLHQNPELFVDGVYDVVLRSNKVTEVTAVRMPQTWLERLFGRKPRTIEISVRPDLFTESEFNVIISPKRKDGLE